MKLPLPALLTLLAILLAASRIAAAERPNIVFILADDQRNDTLGIAGHPHVKTPNIDRLAEHGVLFENMFVNTSICMASRATLFTGLTQSGHGFRPKDPDRNRRITSELVQRSFPTLLREDGYHTGYYGKNHVEFDEGASSAFSRMFDDWKIIGRSPYFKPMPDGTLRHCDEIMGDSSIEFLENRPTDKPFMLYMSFNISHAEDRDRRPGSGHFPWPKAEDGLYESITPHPPRLNTKEHYDANPRVLKDSINRERFFWRWDTPQKYETNMRALYRMLTGMDRIVGRVLSALEEQGIADNTIIVYTADNGYYMGERGFAGKWSHYDESLRVPLIVFNPKLQEAFKGQRREEFVSNIDLPATLLDFANVGIPESYQGETLLPLLENRAPKNWRDFLFCEHHQYRDQIPSWVGIRHQRYVYARYQDSIEILHDLELDPDQLINFANNPEYTKTLRWARKLTDETQDAFTLP